MSSADPASEPLPGSDSAAPVPLNQGNLARISRRSPDVSLPTYDRSAVKVGIVHFGVGGFHRAHQAFYVDRLMNQGKALDWGICGVGVRPEDQKMAQVMREQDCLYTLVTKVPDGTQQASVVGSILEYLFAPDDPRAVIEKIADPETRIVSLTVTEGGYNFIQSSGEFDWNNPDIIHDLQHPHEPRPFFALVAAALRLRKERGLNPLDIVSCDNIAGNGTLARTMFLAYLQRADPELVPWVQEEVHFPNSMVDRITPVTLQSDIEMVAHDYGIEDHWPVVAEEYVQWVLEDSFSGERPALEDAGVQLVEDVEPYELMKLRLLNASHQALAYFGQLAGFTFAHEVAADPDFRRFVRAFMDQEATPTLPPVPGIDLDAYKDSLLERFANPYIADTLARLAAFSSDRIPKWLVPLIHDNLKHDGAVERSAAIVASWARYAEGVGEQGEPLEIVDALREERMQAAARQGQDPLAFVRNPALFGDLVDNPRFTQAYLRALESLHTHGARATVTDFA